MTISIKLPKNTNEDNVAVGCHTKVFNDKGDEIENIMSINISIEPDNIVKATVEVCVDSRSDMENIHALLGTKTLHQIAAMHGFTLESMGVIGNPTSKEKVKG